jgi:hypothetical protein
LLLQLLNQPLSAYWKIAQDLCCINVIEYQDGAIRALSINETQHIKSPSINLKPNHPEVILRMGSPGRSAKQPLHRAVAIEQGAKKIDTSGDPPSRLDETLGVRLR